MLLTTTFLFNSIGFPVLTIPINYSSMSNMPIASQIIAKTFDDYGLLRLGDYLEKNSKTINLNQIYINITIICISTQFTSFKYKGPFLISVKRKQILGIIGIVMAVLGGISWFYQEKLPAIMLWGFAALILFQLNKKKSKFRK